LSAPPFRHIAIVGVGLIGGSIGLAVRHRLRGTRVVGVDRPPVLRRALARGVLHEGTPSLARGIADADLIVLATPVEVILRLLPEVARRAGRGSVVTDVGSTKEAILRAARRAGLGRRFVGGHPMTGSARSGVAHADGGMYGGAAWILCPSGARGTPLPRLRAFVRRLGARPVLLDARRHDEIAARLSHLPQLASVAMVNAAMRSRAARSLRLAGPAFVQMSRLAESSPVLWKGILKTNRHAATRALEDLALEIERLRRTLGRGCSSHFRRAARGRARLVGAPRDAGRT
jgi:prephenate dehydrogenase